MYDPHKRPDYAGEMEVMGRGRLVKARFPDHPVPNVSWFWIPTGNCHACANFTPRMCLSPKISQEDFSSMYVFTNDCPEFRAGAVNATDGLDVGKAVGLVDGEPSQKVEVIRDEPWSIDLAQRAHREQSIFLNMASDVDAGGGDYDEYVDPSSDLEGPSKPPPGFWMPDSEPSAEESKEGGEKEKPEAGAPSAAEPEAPPALEE